MVLVLMSGNRLRALVNLGKTNNIPLQMSDLTSLFSNSDLLLRASLASNFFAGFFVLLVLSLVLAWFPLWCHCNDDEEEVEVVL